jgi:hypothetical protein
MRITILLPLASFYFHNVQGHSAPSCIDTLPTKECAGFPRYYHFNALPTPLPSSDSIDTFFASRDREFQLQAGINKICPELPIAEYTNEYPMASASPGQTLTLQHPPRGHSSQPSSPVWIYMYPQPNMYPGQKQVSSDGFELVAEYPYNNCYGVEKEISWANCTGELTIPTTLTSGVYTFWWRWDLNGIPYNDCFEINVTGPPSTSATNPPSNTPRAKCNL